ncbi:MAG: T9SS type A sorting domain-containing protein [Bacteroidetes bacterium]|nr:T9SS type A sorting domain-containing protein [Bacteroidota bacterium]
MKKVLLFAIFALSIGAIAQNKRPNIQTPPPSRHSLHDVQGIQEDDGLKKTGVYSEMNSTHFTDNQMLNHRELMQIWDSIFSFQWDTLTDGWQLGYKYIDMVYNAKHYLTNYLWQAWNGTAWENSVKVTYTYNAYNLQTSFLGQRWDAAAWVNASQYLYTYDASNNMTSRLYQLWTSGAWANVNQYIYTYDADNNLTSQMRQTWSSGAWVNNYQTIFTYDAANNQTNSLNQNWINDAWVSVYQTIHTYNANNYKTNSLSQTWNGVAWVDSFSGVYTYDVNNNQTNYDEQRWNGNTWENNYQYSCTYDANNNRTKETEQYWIGNTWVNSSQFNYAYDVNNFMISDAYRYWNDAGNLTYGDSTYYFSHAVMGTDDLPAQEGSISVYPNPSQGKFTINCSKTISSIEIFNTLGEQVCNDQKFHLPTSKEIDLSGCDKGIYLVKILIGETRYNKKIVIR